MPVCSLSFFTLPSVSGNGYINVDIYLYICSFNRFSDWFDRKRDQFDAKYEKKEEQTDSKKREKKTQFLLQ